MKGLRQDDLAGGLKNLKSHFHAGVLRGKPFFGLILVHVRGQRPLDYVTVLLTVEKAPNGFRFPSHDSLLCVFGLDVRRLGQKGIMLSNQGRHVVEPVLSSRLVATKEKIVPAHFFGDEFCQNRFRRVHFAAKDALESPKVMTIATRKT